MAIGFAQQKKRKRGPTKDLKGAILSRLGVHQSIGVWTPNDFLDLGSRSAVDKALQRLSTSGEIRRLDRGLYDVPRFNALRGKQSNPDYTAVIEAVARRDKARLVPDGITAANQLGLTNTVPTRIAVHTDARLRPIRLNHLVIEFKPTAPSRLFWAGRPAMSIVQALHWLHDMMPEETHPILGRLKRILSDPESGRPIREDLHQGFDALPGWMRELVGRLLQETNDSDTVRRRGIGRQTVENQMKVAQAK